MSEQPSTNFEARLQRPAKPGGGDWAFIVLPKSASEILPRRGRTSVTGTLNGAEFTATLEPDGQLSHWLKVDETLRQAAGAEPGDTVTVCVRPAASEPEPAVPDDLAAALADSPGANAGWQATTTIARVDWIHWIESAKQAKTRTRRVANACDMLRSGKKRVCCFDPSGHYSNSLSAPKSAD